MKKRHFTIPVFIPEEACPNRCIFCNQYSISGVVKVPSVEEVIHKIESHLFTIPQDNEVEVGFFGGNFTGIPQTMQEVYLQAVQPFIIIGKVSGIRISTRPDYISPEILELLGKHQVKTIELGAQSLDDDVLRLSGRGHSAAQVRQASAMIREAGFALGLQMMVGLPSDTAAKSISTAKEIISLGASSTRIYPTLVIKGTPLEQLFLQGKYQPLSLSEAILQVAGLVELFAKNNVKVLRLGLHPSEGLLDGSSLVAGPFHVAFGEMVYTEIWRKLLVPFLSNQIEGTNFHLAVAKEMRNAAIGFKAANKKMLLQKFSKVIIAESSDFQEFDYDAYID